MKLWTPRAIRIDKNGVYLGNKLTTTRDIFQRMNVPKESKAELDEKLVDYGTTLICSTATSKEYFTFRPERESIYRNGLEIGTYQFSIPSRRNGNMRVVLSNYDIWMIEPSFERIGDKGFWKIVNMIFLARKA